MPAVWGQLEEDYHLVNEMSDLTSFILDFMRSIQLLWNSWRVWQRWHKKVKSPVFLHNAETALEVKECKERWGKTPTALTDALGMYQYGGGGYHCIYMEDQDFEIFRDKGIDSGNQSGFQS